MFYLVGSVKFASQLKVSLLEIRKNATAILDFKVAILKQKTIENP